MAVDSDRYAATPYGRPHRLMGRHGYVYYEPAPLPREVPLTSAVVSLLAEAESSLGRLAGAGRLLPNPHLVVGPFIRREAVSSARIEGTQATLPELFELESLEQPPNADLEEVVNYLRAMEQGISLQTSLPLTGRLIREMHAVLLAGVRGREREPGHFRRSQNWIGPPGTTIETATFVPPPDTDIADLMADWERYAHEQGTTPLLVQCALLHYQFETIHPFLDGNGRLGRLLVVFFLLFRGRLPAPLLYLSPWFERHRDTYYECLQGVRERGDADAWLRFFLEGVQRQSDDAVNRVERLIDLREDYRDRVQSTTRGNALAVVDLAFDVPFLNSNFIERRLDVTRPTALNALATLEALGILAPRTTGPRGQKRWAALEILHLLTESEAVS